MEKLLKLHKINKSYTMGTNSIHVLKDISITIDTGDYVAILGASGSGKSTLMNIIGCMDVSDTGSYLLKNNKIDGASQKELTHIRNKEIGFVFQNYHLIPQYTVEQNIILPLLNKGLSRKDAIAISSKVIKMVGLEDRIEHKPRELSGGQQQRVAIARALVNDPSLILADEPTGALDSQTGASILELFKELNDNGKTIIMITHDLNVANHAKRIMRLSDGEFIEKY